MTKHVSNIATTNCNIRKLTNVNEERGGYWFSHEFVTKSLSRESIGKIETLEVQRGRPRGIGMLWGSVLGSSTPL